MKKTIKIKGMHCASCEVLIERKLKRIEGIESVKVSHAAGEAEIECAREPSDSEIEEAIKADGYSIANGEEKHEKKNTKRDYIELGAVFLIIVALYLILKQFNVLPEKFGITDNMSYGLVFLIGLIAATSTCIAVSGGLLLGVAAKYNEANPNLSRAQKFRPHIYFNIGRIVSYTFFGALIGAAGSLIALSPRTTGVIIIIASVVMVLLGLQLLHIFPTLKRFQLKMPKAIAHKIYDTNSDYGKAAPFLFGGSTFFLPCGFTQALQLYVLSKGDAITGGLTMLVFSLGTLPALVSVGAISSFVKGTFQRYFLRFSAVLIILLGIFNINSGLVLSGSQFTFGNVVQPQQNLQMQAIDQNVQLLNGKQIVKMKVSGYDYYPYRFKVLQGIPVEWQIDGRGAAGCAQVITAPKLGITEYLSKGVKTITFTPLETGVIPFSCTMGMTTPGAAFEVVPNNGVVAQPAEQPAKQEKTGEASCNPEITDCLVQKLSMEISREKGFFPNDFTVKKGIPVELDIDAKVALGGCMSVMVIPEYGVSHRLTLGKSTLKFTPTKEGVVPFTCAMGSRHGQFRVVA